MKQNNIWYLDRGKNFFTQEGQLFFEEMISIFNSLSIYNDLSSNDIIEKFPKKYKESGNPNALLTTVRNIGIINKQNKLSQNAKEYLDYKLSYDELIFENLSQINYDKENEYTVKPFFIICIVLYELFLIKKEYSLITKTDCIEHLYEIKSYDKTFIFNTVQRILLEDRDFTNVKEAVLDIWFNALNHFSIFDYKDKNALMINEDEVDFFKAIYDIYLSGNYELFNNGIYGCIPSLNIEMNYDRNIIDAQEMFDYVFGIRDSRICKFIFGEDSFGKYKPFRTIKNIAIRKINECDSYIGELLYKYSQDSNDYQPEANNKTIEENENNEESDSNIIMQKSEAELFLKNRGIDLSNKEWTYAKNQPNKKCYWMNPPSYLTEKDWYIVLNNQIDSRMIVLLIPKNTLVISNQNDRFLKCRKDRPQYIDIEIYEKDLRIRGTDYVLTDYIYDVLDY